MVICAGARPGRPYVDDRGANGRWGDFGRGIVEWILLFEKRSPHGARFTQVCCQHQHAVDRRGTSFIVCGRAGADRPILWNERRPGRAPLHAGRPGADWVGGFADVWPGCDRQKEPQRMIKNEEQRHPNW